MHETQVHLSTLKGKKKDKWEASRSPDETGELLLGPGVVGFKRMRPLHGGPCHYPAHCREGVYVRLRSRDIIYLACFLLYDSIPSSGFIPYTVCARSTSCMDNGGFYHSLRLTGPQGSKANISGIWQGDTDALGFSELI